MFRSIKLSIIILIAIWLNHIAVSQTMSFNSFVVEDSFNGPAGIFISDINNDNYPDIICAGADANSISWWKNSGDNPINWTSYEIDSNFAGAIYVQAGDIDGDQIIDIVAAAWDDNEISWWRNSGENNIEWTKYIIKEAFLNAHEVNIHDIDQDGDMDIIGVSAGSNTISIFENDGNFPIAWTEHEIQNDFNGARSIDVADIDGDGDMDICGAALDDNEIAWWCNDGGYPIIWTKYIVTTDFGLAHKVQLVDIDLDGDIDILGTGYTSGISWWRNDEGDTIIWERIPISGNNTMVIAWAVDLDLDMDMDIIATAQGSGYISYFENSGQNSLDFDFVYLENFPGAWPLHYGDFDNDGDPDLVCGGNSADEIRWYKNDLITNTDGNINSSNISIYYTSEHNQIIIKSKNKQEGEYLIKLFDAMGRELYTTMVKLKNERSYSINLPNHLKKTGIVHMIVENKNMTLAQKTLFIN